MDKMSADNTRQQTPEELALASKAQVKRAKILWTDDELLFLNHMKDYLESLGYEVEIFQNNIKALERIQSAKPDVVITDLFAPRLSGFEFIQWVKKLALAVPVIVVSGNILPHHDPDGEKAKRALQCGAFACMAKPLKLAHLLRTIHRALNTCKSAKPASETGSDMSKPPVQVKKPKLLITDDERGPLESMTVVLKDLCDVVTFTSKVEAVRRLGEIKPDVVITDIHSPDMNGLDFIRLVKEFDPTILAIILTGYVTMESAREAVRLGVFEYLNKPFGVARLRETVARALEARRASSKS
jgi:DNA-binding NtrC family response regulator